MKITISNDIVVEDPTAEIKQFCRKNLIVKNPEYIQREKMDKWLRDTEEFLDLYTRDGNKLHIPYGSWDKLRELVPEGAVIEMDLANNPDVDYKGAITLFGYQEKAIAEVLLHNCGILVSPCGSGKTQMAIEYILRSKKKALWVTHTKELLKQSYDRAAQYTDKKLLGKITNGKVNISEGITFATVQTLAGLNLQDYRKTWDLIIVDECHRVAGSPSQITRFSKVINNLAASRKYGLTATPYRADGQLPATFALLGEVIYTVSDCEVSDQTIGVTILETHTGVSTSNTFKGTDGKFQYLDFIKNIVDNQERSMLIAQKLLENKEHSNLVLSSRIEHLENIIENLKALGVSENKIRFIHGDMVNKKDKELREQALVDMRNRDANFLFVTYNLAREGLDITPLDRLYLVTPTKNPASVTQSVGRIERVSPDKVDAICYDFVDEKIGYSVGAWRARKSIYNKKESYTVVPVSTPIRQKPDKRVLEALALESF
jgi:superfamily II DNA or RNA helicase